VEDRLEFLAQLRKGTGLSYEAAVMQMAGLTPKRRHIVTRAENDLAVLTQVLSQGCHFYTTEPLTQIPIGNQDVRGTTKNLVYRFDAGAGTSWVESHPPHQIHHCSMGLLVVFHYQNIHDRVRPFGAGSLRSQEYEKDD